MQPETLSLKLKHRMSVLERIYNLYGEFIASYDLACQHGCAACCTCNLTLTTLEGYHVIADMDGAERKALFERVRNLSGGKRFQPHITFNKIAAICRDGKPVPDETIDPAWGACALLVDDSCPVYALRPFGCRCMVSGADCRDTGHARIDDYILTANNLFIQHIEHIDALGGTGSLIDVLLYFDHPARLTTYHKRMEIDRDARLAPNHRIPVLMVPPEHRDRVQPLLQKLRHLIQL